MPFPNKNPGRWLLVLAGTLVVIACAWWFGRRLVEPGSRTGTPPAVAASGIASSSPGASPGVQPVADAKFANSEMLAAFDVVRSARDAKSARLALEELRARLAAMPKAEAVALIHQFLEGKTDAATHLGFKVAADGLLTEAPTFRTFLLDELARIDPTAAADYAKTILASMDSPDEWAVALRNLLRGDTGDDAQALAKDKFLQMLQSSAWQQSPSVGYLEAFDVAVQLGDPAFVPPLTGLLATKDNPAVAHAAYLSLDRMVIANPLQTLSALAADPQAMQGRELTRADYFARLDVRDPQQLAVLENYLLNPQLGAAERQQFLGTYPNANFMLSPNLLTANTTPDHTALAARDAASLQVMDQWLVDPRFASLRPQLEAARQRLHGFVSQEGGHP